MFDNRFFAAERDTDFYNIGNSLRQHLRVVFFYVYLSERFLSKRFLWLYIIAAVLLGFPIKKAMQNAAYRRLIRKLQTGGRHAASEDDAE